MVDITPVPNRFEDRIAEAKDQNILHRLFSQVMIDTINLPLIQHAHDFGIERLCTFQVVTEGFFEDHPPPMPVLSIRQSSCPELLDNPTKEFRRCGEVIKIVAPGPMVPVDLFQ